MSEKYFNVRSIISIILAIVGLVWLINTIWRNMKLNRVKSWPKANATVVLSSVIPSNHIAGTAPLNPQTITIANNNLTYTPNVVYSYTVNGKEYKSEKVLYIGNPSYNARDIVNLMTQLRQGATVPVYYNPENPTEAFVFNVKPSYTGIIGGIILLLLAAFIGREQYFTNDTGTGNDLFSTKKTYLETPNLSETDVPVYRTNQASRYTSMPAVQRTSYTVQKTSGDRYY